MGRIRRSWGMVTASWAVLRQDRELLVLPVMSAVASVSVSLPFLAGIFVSTDIGSDTAEMSPLGWVLTFVMYVCLATITIFFNAALVAAAHERMSGGDPTVSSALEGAAAHAAPIALWGLISGTVSMVLKTLQNRSGVIGRLIVGIAGIAWSLVTYLVLPIMVIEGLPVPAAIRRSKELFSSTWGENVVGNVTIGLIGLLAVLPAFPLAVLAVASGSAVIAVGGLVIAGLWIATVTVVTAALGTVFQTALYHYAARGQVASGFSTGAIAGAFGPKG